MISFHRDKGVTGIITDAKRESKAIGENTCKLEKVLWESKVGSSTMSVQKAGTKADGPSRFREATCTR